MKDLLMISVFLVFFTSVKYADAAAPLFSPVSLTSCENSPQLIFLEYRKIENGEKAWFGNATIPFTIDANSEFTWEFRWWKDGAWENHAKTFKGKACFYLQKFAGKLWKAMREAAKPPLKRDCPVTVGTYSWDKFSADYSTVYLPMIGKGRWSGKISLTKDGKVYCAFFIADMV